MGKNRPVKWNKMLYNQYIAELHEGLDDMKADNGEGFIAEDAVGDIANDIIESDKKGWGCVTGDFPNSGLDKFMRECGISDTVGRLADDIYSGTGMIK